MMRWFWRSLGLGLLVAMLWLAARWGRAPAPGDSPVKTLPPMQIACRIVDSSLRCPVECREKSLGGQDVMVCRCEDVFAWDEQTGDVRWLRTECTQ